MPVIGALAGAVTVALLARYFYYRQKEFELLTKRYLEDGTEAVGASVDRSLAIWKHNWTIAQTVVGMIRHRLEIPSELLDVKYVCPDPSDYREWADYRLVELVGDGTIHKAHQSLDAFVRTTHAYFQYELHPWAKTLAKGGKDVSDILAKHAALMKRYEGEADRFYGLLDLLQTLSRRIERQRWSFRRLRRLSSDTEIKNVLVQLRSKFPTPPTIEEELQSLGTGSVSKPAGAQRALLPESS
jgi:hypothetical protein